MASAGFDCVERADFTEAGLLESWGCYIVSVGVVCVCRMVRMLSWRTCAGSMMLACFIFLLDKG